MPHASPPGFGVFDADNHYYETRDAFSRHLDPRFADRAVKVVTDPETGKDTISVAGVKHHFTPPTYELVPPPGHLQEMLKSHGEGTAASFLKPMRPEYQQREARLAEMDAQGIESCLRDAKKKCWVGACEGADCREPRWSATGSASVSKCNSLWSHFNLTAPRVLFHRTTSALGL